MVKLSDSGNIERNKKKISFVGSIIVTMFILITLPILITINNTQRDFRQRAAQGQRSANITLNPTYGTFQLNNPFSISVKINADEAFNAAKASVTLSSDLTVDSVNITPSSAGGCNFTFANQSSTPSTTNLGFAGTIINGSEQSCILYTAILRSNAIGTSSITISQGSVKSYITNEEIFFSSQNGSYTIVSDIL